MGDKVRVHIASDHNELRGLDAEADIGLTADQARAEAARKANKPKDAEAADKEAAELQRKATEAKAKADAARAATK